MSAFLGVKRRRLVKTLRLKLCTCTVQVPTVSAECYAKKHDFFLNRSFVCADGERELFLRQLKELKKLKKSKKLNVAIERSRDANAR